MKNKHGETVLVVGFTGFKGSGKSIAAARIKETFGYVNRAYASPLKEACVTIFGINYDHLTHDREAKETVIPKWGLSPREIMQKFGTEVGRVFSEDVWVKSMEEFISQRGYDKYVIDDVRFLNEAQAIRKDGGIVIGIRRDEAVPSLTWRDYLPDFVCKIFGITKMHASERTMLTHWDDMVDYTVDNNGSISDMLEKVTAIVDRYEEERANE